MCEGAPTRPAVTKVLLTVSVFGGSAAVIGNRHCFRIFANWLAVLSLVTRDCSWPYFGYHRIGQQPTGRDALANHVRKGTYTFAKISFSRNMYSWIANQLDIGTTYLISFAVEVRFQIQDQFWIPHQKLHRAFCWIFETPKHACLTSRRVLVFSRGF